MTPARRGGGVTETEIESEVGKCENDKPISLSSL